MADENKKGLFAPRAAPPPPTMTPERLNEVFARLRVDEQHSAELRKKMLFIEQNVLSNHRTAISQIKSLQDELTDVKREVQDIEDTIMRIIKELKLTARKEDIDVIRRYVELWDPVKFVTVDTVDRIIGDKLGRVHEVARVAPEVIEPEALAEEEAESARKAANKAAKKAEEESRKSERESKEVRKKAENAEEAASHAEEAEEEMPAKGIESMFESLVEEHSKDRNV